MRMTSNMLFTLIALTLLVFEAKATDPSEGIQAFLQYYGHADGYNERAPLTPAEIEEGLRSFQRFFNLPVTGQLDTQTKELIGKERCDMPDIATRTGRFAISGNRWASSITWVLNWTHPAVPASEAIRVMKESVQEWQAWMTTITVTQSTNINSVIVINYPTSDSAGNHGDPYPFASTTLAHAFFPNPGSLAGDMHYNMDKPFSTSEPPSSTTFSLKQVTVHELGHALGLAHSGDSTAIMYPYASRGFAYKGLARDDKLGIQTLYGPCTSAPCKNGGTCTHTASNPPYTCSCAANYAGTNCESGQCSTNPCKFGGTCIVTAGGNSCQCPSTHTGSMCETLIPCSSGPCQNGGTCTNTPNYSGYTCACPSTHMGTNCQTVTSCSSGPCMNGGTCSPASNTAGYTCTCTNSYSGNQCQVSKCSSGPCLNQGTCIPDAGVVAGYRCNCMTTYTGNVCQTSVCASSPCRNGGTCQLNPSGSTGYVCLCTNGYGGNICQTRTNPLGNGSKTVSSASWWTLRVTLFVYCLLKK